MKHEAKGPRKWQSTQVTPVLDSRRNVEEINWKGMGSCERKLLAADASDDEVGVPRIQVRQQFQ